MRTVNFGTVSHGTLRTEDLIDAFAAELEWQVQHNADYFQLNEAMRSQRSAYLDLVNDAREIVDCGDQSFIESDNAADIVNSMIDALQDFAPDYGYFGSHPGDGSDFGFWLSEDALDQFDGLRVSDTAEVPNDYCGEVLHINDHGNATLYVCEGGQLREVWSVV